jgi:hypothetical protein
MPGKHRRPEEILFRDIEIAGLRAWCSVNVANTRGGGRRIDRGFSFELVGMMTEPVGEVRRVAIRPRAVKWLAPNAEHRLAVGQIVELRPELVAFVEFVEQDHDRIWSLANAGLLKHARLAFTRPRYRRAFVTGFWCSTHPDEFLE